ncbi:mammalian ependymin-related protein 1-like [Mizuhopecten yessoensis]|uniref:Mammalian ependymin-related protein 1 n=1 Tax=Mizuhopecten yessoensis TaxID=6573 RepID=A0A210PL06_MIZYE|nr:mammalian ependymin-related protein 1-like [Mizuhopecten yessoensis]OWF37116.1 Mammalian ependymin-related protein 1 [Mizuhopecten yessoensis]
MCDHSHVDMKVALVILSLVGAVFGQLPTPCNSPNQWEARERVVEYGAKFEEWHKVYYDGSSGRERNIAEVEDGSTRDFFDILTLYNENKRYMINMKTKQCNVTAINRPFRHRGVPPNAQFSYAFTLGATGFSGQSITVQSFTANVTFGTFHEEYFGMVTSPSCVPVNNFYYNPSEQTKSVVAYYDLTVGISDPMAFVPPPQCNSS